MTLTSLTLFTSTDTHWLSWHSNNPELSGESYLYVLPTTGFGGPRTPLSTSIRTLGSSSIAQKELLAIEYGVHWGRSQRIHGFW